MERDSLPGWARGIAALHVALAAFVTLRGYPITQDGPAHLYAAHILRSLAGDPHSPFRGFFDSTLRPIPNSLFYYVAEWAGSVMSAERVTGLAMLVALIGLPVAAFWFAAALRGDGTTEAQRRRVDPAAAACIACPLAYNYFLYRGFFNFCWAVPAGFGCLAALVATGDAPGRAGRSLALGSLAAALAAVAALAHPAVLVFLACAIPAACLSAPRRRRVAGAAVMLVILPFAAAGTITGQGPSPTVFSTPWSSVARAVRVLGVTHGWPELAVSIALVVILARAAAGALVPLRGVLSRWRSTWPAACAVVMIAAFFVVPFEYGGAAGHNERIPLIAAMLLAPFVVRPSRHTGWAVAAFAVFAVYSGTQSVRLERLASRVREAEALAAIPPGSLVYPVSLQLKLGSLSADLGRHILADVARQRNLVMPDVFCGHPAQPLRCTPRLPVRVGEAEVEAFEHLPARERERALSSNGDVAGMFERMRPEAARASYLVVLSSDSLQGAFDARVAEPLGAQLVGLPRSPLRIYRLPPIRH